MEANLESISARIANSNGGSTYNINLNATLGGNAALDSLISSELLPFPSFSPVDNNQRSFFSDTIFKQESQALMGMSEHTPVINAISSMISNTDLSYLQMRPEIREIPMKSVISPLVGAIEADQVLSSKLFGQTNSADPKHSNSNNFVMLSKGPMTNQTKKIVASPPSSIPMKNGPSTSAPLTPMNGHNNKTNEVVPQSAPRKRAKASTEAAQEEAWSPKRFNTIVEEIIRMNSGQDKENNPNASGPSLEHLKSLFIEALKIRESKLWKQVPEDLIKQYLALLGDQVKKGAGLVLDETDPEGCGDFEQVSLSLESALVILVTLTSEGIPKTLYDEELLHDVIKLTGEQIQKNVFNVFTAAALQAENVLMEEDDKKVSKSKKRASKGGHPSHGSISSKLLHKLCLAFDNLNLLVANHTLTDSMVRSLIFQSAPVFFDQDNHSLQLKAIQLLRTIFSKYNEYRETIVDKIFEMLTKLPKKKAKAFSVDAKTSIQMVSALFMQLFQSCTSLPVIAASPVAEKTDTTTNSKSKKKVVPKPKEILPIADDYDVVNNSYATSLASSLHLVKLFIQKCTNKSIEADYRGILEGFIEDLLTVLNTPEWPVAETLLMLLSSNLATFMSKTEVIPTFRMACVEFLGDILCKVNAEINTQKKLNGGNNEVEDGMEVEKKEDVSCICGAKEYGGEFMIDCDLCLRWYHGACVNISESHPPATWECSECQLKKKIMNTISKSLENKKAKTAVDDELVKKQKLLSYLALKAGTDGAALYSRQYWLAQWFEIATEEDLKEYYSSVWDINSKAQKDMFFDVTYPNAVSLCRDLASQKQLFKQFNNLLKRVLDVLKESHANIRSKAIKTLSTLIDSDPSILSNKDVQAAVEGRINDPSISVREATIELIGKYMISKPEIIGEYKKVVAERVRDTGRSVRKRVVKILGGIILRNPSHPDTADICSRLILRITDESSISDIVIKTFQNLWFGDVKAKDNGSDIATRAEQIMKVVEVTQNHEWLVELIEKLLSDTKQKVESICKQICANIAEKLYRLDEQRASNISSEEKTSISITMGNCLTTLSLFCSARPLLLIPHAQDMQPHIRSKDVSSKTEQNIIQNVLTILEQVVPIMEEEDRKFVPQMEQDLVSAIERHGSPITTLCIKCLGTIVTRVTQNETLMQDLFVKYYSPLLKYAKQTLNKQTKSEVLRSLFVVGLLLRYYDYGSIKNETEGVRNLLGKSGELVNQVYLIFDQYAKINDSQIQSFALKGFGHLYIRNPKLLDLAQSKDQISRALSGSADKQIKGQMLKNLMDLLYEEDKRMKQESKEVKQSGDASKKQRDMSLNGGMIQQFSEEVLRLLSDEDSSTRSTALSAVGIMIRHGLVNPLECLPHLVALLTDHTPAISEKALRLVNHVDEKHPDYLYNRVLEGIRQSYKFQNALFRSKGLKVFNSVSEANFAGIYSNFKKNRRPKFLSSVLKAFEDGASEVHHAWVSELTLQQSKDKKSKEEEDARFDPTYLRYIAEVVASLPFSTEDEPLFVVYTINRIISLTASPVWTSLKPIFRQAKVTKKDLDDNKENLQKMPCVVLMLMLKVFMKKFYSLSHSKCANFELNTSTKVSKKEGPSYDAVYFEHKNSPFAELDPEHLTTVSDWKNLFETFNTLMKDDQVNDHNTNTTSVKTKRRRSSVGGATATKKTVKRPRKKKEVEFVEEAPSEDDE